MIILLVLIWPLLLGVLLVRRDWIRATAPGVLPLAAAPALALALWGDASLSFDASWLIMGTQFGLEGGGPLFLLLTAFLWLIAGWFAPAYLGDAGLRRYAFFHLLTFTGNTGLVLAEEVTGFYACFALMTFAAYGLVIHTGTAAARRAGRVYLTVAILGEALLLAALFLAVDAASSWRLQELGAAVAQSEHRAAIIALALFGFGVKAGLLPVHFWLPLAHPVAPAPASAVLSGAMIKAGVLGWMHVLPLGHGTFAGWGLLVIILGLLAGFYAVACGLAQSDPKTNLAYSSISHMGLITMGIGAGLAAPDTWPALRTALVVYALNHALAKGALFLGAGLSSAGPRATRGTRMLIVSGLAYAVLIIAGAPLTGGAVAKNALKSPTLAAAGDFIPHLGLLLSLLSLATTFLLGRFLVLVAAQWRSEKSHHVSSGAWLAWLVLLPAAGGAATFAVRHYGLDIYNPPESFSSGWSNAWPILAGGVLAWLTSRRVLERAPASIPRIPPGDMVVPLERIATAVMRNARRVPAPETWHLNVVPVIERIAKSRPVQEFFNHVEIRLKRWETAGLMLLLLLLVFWISLR